MKIILRVLGLVILVLALPACGSRDKSPQIVCDVEGEIVSTGFTFDSLKGLLAAEHGQVTATDATQLKTRSVVVSFRPLENGTLLAEGVVAHQTGEHMSPAVFFDLKKAVGAALQPGPLAAWATNTPAAAPNNDDGLSP